ncbi:G protein-regulated inducer of neurite outgrowth 1 [Xiphophorus hellerii]|uniref:G protein-regulated inducer of neurite outgrowth 1 n=1 Tax=Xiphophorus hellerii TaxID=8084 RepID=UPI0013B38D6C|nr:G protein-regulated inducer of neurite outgrowth 1 [Xiphophorus hellerii]
MGSLKDEKRALREDRQPCEKTNNEGLSEDSDSSAAAEGCPLRTCQESTASEDCQSKRHMDASSVGNSEKTLKSRDTELCGVDSKSTDPSVFEPVKDCAQPDDMPVTLQTVATQNEATVSTNNQGNGDAEGENVALDKGNGTDVVNIFVPVPSTPDPSDPRSPAPFGQQHMRTQVSLEVAQCCSAATSPMTPPEGDHSFFFPSNFGKHGARPVASAAGTHDEVLQVGQQVEFCSVATSPMTPKTPSSTAFPVLVGRGTGQKEEKTKKEEEQRETGQKKSCATTKCTEELSKNDESLKCAKGLSSYEPVASSTSGLATAVTHSQGTFEDSTQQCKQQKMGSMDQDITILVTHYGNNDEEAESHFQTVEPDMVKIEETEKGEENISSIKSEDRKEMASTVAPGRAQEKSSPKQPQKLPGKTDVCTEPDNSEVMAHKGARVDLKDVSVPKSPIPESPAPFGCHNIRTQVSLEVVQCQSVATSPMTPPEGDQAFYFPSSLGKCVGVGTETKDAEMRVGQQVEFRSVATAPMTPRTPVATTFPEIKKEVSIEEKIVEEKEEENREQLIENTKEVPKEVEKLTQKESVGGDSKDVENCKEKDEEKCEEPVQEVSWDEKGMTWEVYGAVVEVAVLGSAIQKHLEKQVQKQKQLTAMPPPPPLNPAASPLPPEPGCGGSGKRRGRKKGEHDGKASRRRRNPFRLLMENVQQPHCCSKAHTTE